MECARHLSSDAVRNIDCVDDRFNIFPKASPRPLHFLAEPASPCKLLQPRLISKGDDNRVNCVVPMVFAVFKVQTVIAEHVIMFWFTVNWRINKGELVTDWGWGSLAV